MAHVSELSHIKICLITKSTPYDDMYSHTNHNDWTSAYDTDMCMKMDKMPGLLIIEQWLQYLLITVFMLIIYGAMPEIVH